MNAHRKIGLGLLLLTAFARPVAAQKTYVAVGDSLAYGFKSFNPTPNQTTPGGAGYPGYTSAYRSDLQTQTGNAYTVIDLGVVGETTSALFTTATSVAPNAALNSNYLPGSPTQAGLLHTILTDPSNTVSVITIQVGANDVLQALESGNPTAPTAALAAVQSNYTVLLNQIKTDEGGGSLPNVTILGYYDPYLTLSPTNYYYPLLQASHGLVGALNTELAQAAASYGARYVDLAGPFSSHLAGYDNYVLANSAADALPDPTGGSHPVPNDHPTDLGYALIAQQLAAPEPPALGTLGLGVLGLTGMILRARKRRTV